MLPTLMAFGDSPKIDKQIRITHISSILTGTVSGDVKQSKQHKTISFMGALRGLVSSPMQLQKDSLPSSSFLSSLRGKSSSDMFQESPQPTYLGDRWQELPLSCQTAESSPHSPYLNQFGSERGSSDENIVRFEHYNNHIDDTSQ